MEQKSIEISLGLSDATSMSRSIILIDMKKAAMLSSHIVEIINAEKKITVKLRCAVISNSCARDCVSSSMFMANFQPCREPCIPSAMGMG